jgi:Protein of unknown function (DUF3151)
VSPASSINFTAGVPETVLPPLSAEILQALEAASKETSSQRRAAYGRIASTWPRCLDAWASLAEGASDPIDRYAYARVGYHRGLDTLRGAGWRGSGYVRWRHPSNHGFLRCLEGLRSAAQLIGESEEEERCAVFLRQLDPDWPPPDLSV